MGQARGALDAEKTAGTFRSRGHSHNRLNPVPGTGHSILAQHRLGLPGGQV